MEIYLLRHGIAADLGSKIHSDSERPLTEEGFNEMRDEAKGMKRLGLEFTTVLTSPLIRAKQTAAAVAEILNASSKIKLCQALGIPLIRSALVEELETFHSEDKVMMVGHEPDMGHLAAYFLGTAKIRFPFKKGSLCRIDISRPSSPGGELKWFLTPKQLKLIGRD